MASAPPGAWPDGGALPSPPSPSRRLFAAGRVRVSPLPASVVAGESIAFRNVGGGQPGPDTASQDGSETGGAAEVAAAERRRPAPCCRRGGGSGGGSRADEPAVPSPPRPPYVPAGDGASRSARLARAVRRRGEGTRREGDPGPAGLLTGTAHRGGVGGVAPPPPPRRSRRPAPCRRTRTS